MLEEVLLLGEAFWALTACVWPLTCVDPLMLDHTEGAGEPLPTVQAPKDLSSPARVHTLAAAKGFLLGEPRLALTALVGPPFRVGTRIWLADSIGIIAFQAPRTAEHLVHGWGAGAGFGILVLLEPLCGPMGPVFFHMGLAAQLIEEALLASSVLTAILCAVALLVRCQHLLQTSPFHTLYMSEVSFWDSFAHGS